MRNEAFASLNQGLPAYCPTDIDPAVWAPIISALSAQHRFDVTFAFRNGGWCAERGVPKDVIRDRDMREL